MNTKSMNMLFRQLTSFCLISGTVSLSVLADGDTYYLTLEGKDAKYCLEDASYWKNSQGTAAGESKDPLAADDSFVIGNAYVACTPNSNVEADSFTFSGAKLYVGNPDPSASERKGNVTHHSGKTCVIDYGEDKLQFVCGSYLFGNANHCVFNVKGSITVRENGLDQPFMIYSDSRYVNRSVNWTGDLKSDATGVKLQIGSASARKSELGDEWFVFSLNGSAAGFSGELAIVAPEPSALAPHYRTYFQCGGVFGGMLKLNPMTTLMTPSNALAVAGLDVADGARLQIRGDFESHSSFSVQDYSHSGTVDVYLEDPFALMKCDADSHRMTLLTVPLGTGLAVENFRLLSDDEALMFFSLDTEEDATSEHLVLIQQPVVSLSVTDVQSKDEKYNGTVPPSAFETESSWSDRKTPHSGAHYYIRRLSPSDTDITFARTPSSEYNFPGESLVIGDHALVLQCCGKLTVDTLVVLDGGCLHTAQNVSNPELRGSELQARSGRVYLTSYNARNYNIYPAITGAAEIFFNGIFGGTSRPDGGLTICGDTDGFTGRFTVSHINILLGRDAVPYSSSYPGFFYIWNGVFDAPQASFDWRGIELSGKNEICPRGSTPVTMQAASNRGLYVNGTGTVNNLVKYGDFTVNWPLTFNGTLIKKSAGKLLLGGAAAQFIGEDGSRGFDPVEEKNVFIVSNGVVAVTAVDSLNGVAIRVADDAELEVSIDVSDATHLRYGLRNVLTPEPFRLIGSSSGLPVKCVLSGVPEVHAEKSPMYVGVLTVSSEAAASIRAMMTEPVRIEGLKAFKVTAQELVEGDTVTFGYLCSPMGFVLTLR